MSSCEGCLWSLLTAAYVCNVISCCFKPSACCFVLCDVMKAAGKPSLLESHSKYFGCWSGIINCWVMASLWNHNMLHFMIVFIIIFGIYAFYFIQCIRMKMRSSKTFPWSIALANWHMVLTKYRSTVLIGYKFIYYDGSLCISCNFMHPYSTMFLRQFLVKVKTT